MPQTLQIVALLFLMLGPFKVLGPFAKLTQHADRKLTLKIALLGTLYASIALLLAAVLGENILRNFNIPVPILALAAGIIFFLVALLNVIHQYSPPDTEKEIPSTPTLKMAISPLAFPTIVTPYGIAAVIVFLALSPDVNTQITVGVVIIGIMLLNLVLMLINQYIFKYLALILPILGAVLGVIQVAVGLMIIYNSLRNLLNLPNVPIG